MSERIAALRRALPDAPRWVEARALLAHPDVRLFEDAAGLLVRHDAAGLGVVDGGLEAATLGRALEGLPATFNLLATPEAQARVAALLPDWRSEHATLYALGSPDRLPPPPESPVRVLGADARLALWPAELREEIEAAVRRTAVSAAFAGDRPVSVCYAHLETEGQGDLSIDTVAAYRRRGFGLACARHRIQALLDAGKRPVWGAVDSNLPSRALALRLGFEPADELWVFTPPPTE